MPAKGEFLPFGRARAVVRKLKLQNRKEWEAWSKSAERPANIPSDPRKVYRDCGWVSTADWLGYEERGCIKRIKFLPFGRARAVVRKLKLQNKKEWQAWSKSAERPANIPSDPRKVYRDCGWVSTADWLGYEERGCIKRIKFLPFGRARAVVRKLKLQNWKEWEAWSKSAERPANIPSDPRNVYRDCGWVSTADWLGCEERGSAKHGKFLPFGRARAVVRKLKLQNWKAWKAWSKSSERPASIPSSPERTYSDCGWVSTADWLGYEAGNRRQKKRARAEEKGESDVAADSDIDAAVAAQPDDDECSICLEPLSEAAQVRTLPCSHRFCAPCVDNAILRAAQESGGWGRRGVMMSCPLCRSRTRCEPSAKWHGGR